VKPAVGSKRTVRRFAWKPVQVDSGTAFVWLEWYVEEQELCLLAESTPTKPVIAWRTRFWSDRALGEPMHAIRRSIPRQVKQ